MSLSVEVKKLIESILLVYFVNGWNLDNAVRFIINTIIDEYIINILPDNIKNCEYFRACIEYANAEDVRKVIRNEPTDIDSIDCLVKSLGVCVG